MSRLILAACVLAVTACGQEIGSETYEGGTEDRRASIAYASPSGDATAGLRTHLYSERDADVFNRLMIEETAGGGIPVTAIHVEVGSRVRQGSILATLENSDARLYVEAAEPRAEVAAANFRRIEELRQSGAVSEAEYEQALFDKRTAEAALAQAQLNLSRTEIRAPFGGVVSRRYVRVGDIVDNETPLFRVTAMAPLRARLLVPENEVKSFRVGAPVNLTSAAGHTASAKVVIVGPTIDAGSGTREVIVELSEVGELRPGAAVTATLPGEAAAAGGDEPGGDAADKPDRGAEGDG